tara:strand:+ start:853 stop:960 length:108 start_codon:yes stop_codon:yes gene_type:complete
MLLVAKPVELALQTLAVALLRKVGARTQATEGQFI